MNAAHCRRPRGPAVLGQVELPAPDPVPGDVLNRVQEAGITRADGVSTACI